MSKISDLVIEINDLLEQGRSVTQIARELDVPIHWVSDAADIMSNSDRDCFDPFATINS